MEVVLLDVCVMVDVFLWLVPGVSSGDGRKPHNYRIGLGFEVEEVLDAADSSTWQLTNVNSKERFLH